MLTRRPIRRALSVPAKRMCLVPRGTDPRRGEGCLFPFSPWAAETCTAWSALVASIPEEKKQNLKTAGIVTERVMKCGKEGGLSIGGRFVRRRSPTPDATNGDYPPFPPSRGEIAPDHRRRPRTFLIPHVVFGEVWRWCGLRLGPESTVIKQSRAHQCLVRLARQTHIELNYLSNSSLSYLRSKGNDNGA